MNIIENIIPKGQGVRNGKSLYGLKGLVVHWIGVSQPSANKIRNNFSRDKEGTHYVIDYNNGDIIHCVPDNEVCYHVGAKDYTKIKESICGSVNPNYYLGGIECCVSATDKIYDDYFDRGKYPNLGKPSDIQYKCLVEFCAYWLKKNKLTTDNLYRHYDITGKSCPIWFKNWPDEWDKFKQEVNKKMIEEYTKVDDIVWDLGHRGIVSGTEGLKEEMNANPNGRLYWLARKSLQYIRERD